MIRDRKLGLIVAAVAGLAVVGGLAFLSWHRAYSVMGHGHAKHGHFDPNDHANGNHEHPGMIMPGLRGENVTEEESADLDLLFRNFETLSRTVENLPNGIRSVTTSSDPEVMDALVAHVSMMIGRVETGDDPKVFIQSPTLDIFFERHENLVTEIELTDAGIVVVQTSDDPELVAAMHVHAAEVTAMAERGMDAVHEMMSKRTPY